MRPHTYLHTHLPTFRTLKMTVYGVKIIVGYRVKFVHDDDENTWLDFCKKFYKESDGTGIEDVEDVEDESDKDKDRRRMRYSGYFYDYFYDYLKEHIGDNVKYNTIICHHQSEGMVRMIDIGFSIGKFNILGLEENSSISIEDFLDVFKNANNKKFFNNLKKTFLWPLISNKEKPEVFGQANDCLFCS